MKKFLLLFGILFMCLGVNINAEYVDNETPAMEQYESEYITDATPKSRGTLTRGALTIPTEGVYDTIKDTHNAAGVMTARSFYYKGKLVEKRTYTQTGSKDCRMRNKYLYFSDGSTVERHRTYSNTGATCYNLQTKVYGTNSKIKTHTFYEGKVNGKITEIRAYEVTGTYYTSKSFYTNGILKTREYWKGENPNRVTHKATFNSAGTAWINVTYNYYPNSEDKKEYVVYNGNPDNLLRKTSTGYREDGTKQWYKQYNSEGLLYHLTQYDATGTIKTVEAEIYPEEQVREWEITYQENGIDRKSVTYQDKDGILTESLSYYAGNNGVEWETLYNEEGNKATAKRFEQGTSNVIEEIMYQGDNKSDVITYYDTAGIVTRKVRYFQDGSHLRWDINYVDGEKESVKLYDNKNNYEYKETYNYTENDYNLSQMIAEDYDFSDRTYISVFENNIISRKISNLVELSEDDTLFLEDLLVIENLTIDNLENESLDEDIEAEIDMYPNLSGIQYLSNLKFLKINYAGIEIIPLEIQYLTKLQHLDLSNNRIAEISEDFYKLDNLKTVNLATNNIDSISLNYKNIDNLETVNLRGNDIKFVDGDLLKNSNTALFKIYIDENTMLNEITYENIEDLINNETIYTNENPGFTISKNTETTIEKKDKSNIESYNFYDFFRDIETLNKKNEGIIKISILSGNENLIYESNKLNYNDILNNLDENTNSVYTVNISWEYMNYTVKEKNIIKFVDKIEDNTPVIEKENQVDNVVSSRYFNLETDDGIEEIVKTNNAGEDDIFDDLPPLPPEIIIVTTDNSKKITTRDTGYNSQPYKQHRAISKKAWKKYTNNYYKSLDSEESDPGKSGSLSYKNTVTGGATLTAGLSKGMINAATGLNITISNEITKTWSYSCPFEYNKKLVKNCISRVYQTSIQRKYQKQTRTCREKNGKTICGGWKNSGTGIAKQIKKNDYKSILCIYNKSNGKKMSGDKKCPVKH